MLQRSLFRPALPPPAVAFSSERGRALFAEAQAAGCLDGWWRLAETFTTQEEPAFCGLASLSMALNALAVDPCRVWKAPWRWFHSELLDCCVPLEDVKRSGVTLETLACLARCNGARVSAHRAPPLLASSAVVGEENDAASHITGCASAAVPSATCAQFEAHVRAACSAATGAEQPAHVLVVSYSRAVLGQSGEGHFSCLGAFAPDSRQVLILDVARFKYPPHWVTLDQLWAAMQATDVVTGRPRGYLLLSADAGAAPLGKYMTLSRRGRPCACNAGLASNAWLECLLSGKVLQLERVRELPDVLEAVELYGAQTAQELEARRAVVEGVRQTALFTRVKGTEHENERHVVMTLLLLAAAPEDSQLPAAVADEVKHLRTQLSALQHTEKDACA